MNQKAFEKQLRKMCVYWRNLLIKKNHVCFLKVCGTINEMNKKIIQGDP